MTDAGPLQLEATQFELPDGETISGVCLPGPKTFTVLLLHDIGGDLDAVLPLLGTLGLAEAHKLAVDLPGHGLSGGDIDSGATALHAVCDALAATAGRLLIVACGRSAALGWSLARRTDVAGLVLVAPRLDGPLADAELRRVPVLTFLAASSPEVGTAWDTLRGRLRARWLVASLAVGYEELAGLRGAVTGQVASHITGFAREMLMRIAPRSP